MSKVNFDPEEFKINQKNSWDSALNEVYNV
jgi:hypothetical protein